MNAHRSFSQLLVEMGRAGVEIVPFRSDPTRIMFRSPWVHALDPSLESCIRNHADRLREILDTDSCGLGDDDAFLERLGIADELELSTCLGSPAWLIAAGESLAATAGSAFDGHAARWTAIVQNVLGSPVRVQMIAPGERFEGEPDWGDPWARSRLPAPGAGGVA